MKRIWVILAGVVVLLLIGFFVVQHLLDADTYRGKIEQTLSDSLGRQVTLGHLDVSLFSGDLVATSASIADDPAFSQQPFLTAKDVKIGVEVGPLIFHHEVHVTGFTVDEPKIALIRAENGSWNYSSLGSEGKRKTPTAQTNDLIPNLTVGKVEIKNGTLTLGSQPATGQPRVYDDLNVSVQNFAFAKAFPFSVNGKLPGGGSLSMTGTAGPISQQDASLTPVTAQVSLQHADLVAAGMAQPSQGISGVADLDTKIVSNGQTAQADGKLHLTQLKLAKNGTPSTQPVDLQFSVNQDLKSLSGKINSANLQVGKAALAITGTYQTQGNATTTQISVNGQNMPIDQLVAFLPSLGVQLPSGSRLQSGSLTMTLNVSGPTTAPVISGPVRIANAQLAGFDLGQKLSSLQALTGAKTGSTTTIEALSTDLRYSPAGTQTNNLAAVVSGLGSASGSGSISPAGALNYRLLVKLGSSGIGAIATQAMSLLPGAFGSAISSSTKNGIPLVITGTTANPAFSVDMGKMVGGQVPSSSQTQSPLGKALGSLFGRE